MPLTEIDVPLAYQGDPNEPVMASGYEIAEMLFRFEGLTKQKKSGPYGPRRSQCARLEEKQQWMRQKQELKRSEGSVR
jgi:hypothetical protein